MYRRGREGAGRELADEAYESGLCLILTFQWAEGKSAQFGRAFTDFYDPSSFVAMGQTLKALNAVRHFEVGIAMTFEQWVIYPYIQMLKIRFSANPPAALITALTTRNLHLLALRVSQHLDIPVDPVLKHWAAAKISRAHPEPGQPASVMDEEICKAIVARIRKEAKGVSFAEIARTAWGAGRTRLATMLLEHETLADAQVPLLLQMKEDRRALSKSIESGDPDLVYQVVLHLHSILSPGDFFHLIDDSSAANLTPATRLLQVYGREADRQMVRDFYYQNDDWVENGCLDMEEAGSSTDVNQRIDHLKAATRSFGQRKDREFETKSAQDAQRLLELQLAYERETNHEFAFAGLGVSAFISQLLMAGYNKRAERVRADWHVSDRRFWWIKLKAMAQMKEWDALETFAKSRKSPIGYEPFVNHLLSIGQPARAAAYVVRCDAKLRADLYVKCGDWGRAAEAAKERGDGQKLE